MSKKLIIEKVTIISPEQLNGPVETLQQRLDVIVGLYIGKYSDLSLVFQGEYENTDFTITGRRWETEKETQRRIRAKKLDREHKLRLEDDREKKEVELYKKLHKKYWSINDEKT